MPTTMTSFQDAFGAAAANLTQQAMSGLIAGALGAVLLLSCAWAAAGIFRQAR